MTPCVPTLMREPAHLRTSQSYTTPPGPRAHTSPGVVPSDEGETQLSNQHSSTRLSAAPERSIHCACQWLKPASNTPIQRCAPTTRTHASSPPCPMKVNPSHSSST